MGNGDIRQLLEHCTIEISNLSKTAGNGEINKVFLKNTLENLRSALDYLAKDILIKLKSNPNLQTKKLPEKTYFPYGQKENHFKKSIQRNLPFLKQSEPKVYDLLESIQPFRSKHNWVVDLCSLTNDAKHNNLSKIENQKNVIVEQKGIARIEGGRNVVMSNNYVNGVRQDDVFIDGNGEVNVEKYSETTIITSHNRIKFHGKELEIIPFLTYCEQEIKTLSVNIELLL